MTVPCPNCGRLNRPGARFCASCQTPLQPSGEASSPPPIGAGPLQPGQMLGNGAYRVVRALGKGGMGAVWLVAQLRAFDRLAVLKEVIEYFDPGDGEARQKALARFEAEARTLADLKHPGIPDLYAYFSEGGHNYLVMEYIEGPDLSQGLTREDRETGQFIRGGPLPAEDVLRYTIQICEVLEYLASRQPPVVHNDIKPANIILDKNSGRPVLVDFGTAKTRYLHAAGRPEQKRDSVYGTVGYAAPELYRGHSEPRSDVYSLAATAYHLWTDDDPRDHPGQYPKLEELPTELARVLRAALAPEVSDRLNAKEFRQQLERFLAGEASPLRVLPFPDGDTASGRTELVAQAVAHWGYAAGLLQDGTLARWLRGVLRDAAAAQAADEAVRRWPGNPDAALDDLLRSLDPRALPPGVMELRTASVRLTGVAPGTPLHEKIEIFNRGKGFLRGEAFSTMDWVRVSSNWGCPPGAVCSVPIEIDPSGLFPGQRYLAAVTLAPAGGAPEVVPIEVMVAGAAAAPVPGKKAAPIVSADRDHVELSASPRDLSSSRGRLVVSNSGQALARCRVMGAPPWLLVRPVQFQVAAGAQAEVELVARVARVPGRRQEAVLTIAVEGGQGLEVRVTIQIKGAGLFG